MSLFLRIPSQGIELQLEADDPPALIGRDGHCGVVFTSRLVSSRHARVAHLHDGWVVEDLGSTNGTFVDGVQLPRLVLSGPTVVRLGDPAVGELIEFEPVTTAPELVTAPRGLPAVDPGVASGRQMRGLHGDASPVFAVHELTVTTNGTRRLDRLSFALPAGTMLGVLGGSGAGKSTLVKAITGSDPATEGVVAFEGRDLYADYVHVRRRVGYVPQDDTLHLALSVRATLQYGAELRMPESSRSERAARVDEVLTELGLGHRIDARVSELSGGQRKRLSVALELLSRPPLLILDEPTSGLDPANERSVMQLLRQLADGGRTVIVVTHSTESLHLCDEVLLLARGGVPAFLGPAEQIPRAFGQSNLIDAFSFVDNHPEPATLRATFEQMHVGLPAPVLDHSMPADVQPRSSDWRRRIADAADDVGHDLWSMTRRALDLLRGDRRNTWILAAQAPLIGVLLMLLFNGGNLDRARFDHNGEGANLLMAAVLAVIFMGAAGAVREIVKERALMLREQAVGVSTVAYLGSKLLVNGTVVVIQAVVIVVLAGIPNAGPTDSLVGLGPANEVVVAVALAGLVATATGLLISALVTSNDKAMTLLPVYLFVQLLLAGMIVPVHRGIMKPLSWLVTSKWGLDAVGAVGDMWALRPDCGLKSDQDICSQSWHHEAQNWLVAVVFLVAMLGAAVYGTYRALHRNDPATVLAEKRKAP